MTRIERNSSPNLTVGDAQLSVTYHAVIVLSPLLATMIGSIMGLGLPIQLIIDRAVSSLDFGHFFLLIWGCGLVLICLKFATANQNMKKTEMTTEERKVSFFFEWTHDTHVCTVTCSKIMELTMRQSSKFIFKWPWFGYL